MIAFLATVGLAAFLVAMLRHFAHLYRERELERRRQWRDEIDDEWASYMAERQARVSRAVARYRTTHGRTLEQEAARRDERRAA